MSRALTDFLRVDVKSRSKRSHPHTVGRKSGDTSGGQEEKESRRKNRGRCDFPLDGRVDARVTKTTVSRVRRHSTRQRGVYRNGARAMGTSVE